MNEVERLVMFDHRAKSFFVQSFSKTMAGFWTAEGDPVLLPSTCGMAELGQALMHGLLSSRTGVAVPPVDADLSVSLRELAGVRTYGEYMKGTRSVEVYTADGGETVELTPMRNGGPKEGFTADETRTEVAPFDTYDQLGSAALRILALATS